MESGFVVISDLGYDFECFFIHVLFLFGNCSTLAKGIRC